MKLNPRDDGPGTVVDFEIQWKARQLVLIHDDAKLARSFTASCFTLVAESYAREGNHEAAKLFTRAALEATRAW